MLFEAYHPFVPRDRLAQILAKYQVGERTDDPISPAPVEFTFDSPFRRDLVECVHAYFQALGRRSGRSVAEATKCPPQRSVALAVGGAVYVVLHLFGMCGWWWGEALGSIVDWVWGVNVFHDAMHFALTPQQRVNEGIGYLFPMFVHPFDWQHQHNVGHHSYTNVPHHDPDLNVGYPLVALRPHSSKRRPTSWIHARIAAFMTLGLTMIVLILPWHQYTCDKLHGAVPWRWEMLGPRWRWWIGVPKGIYLIGWWVLPILHYGVGWTVAFRTAFSCLFMLYTQVGHVHPHCQSKPQSCWAQHQVETTSDFAHSSLLQYTLSGGLNFQVVHHLFPGINHGHHRALAPIIARVCLKHGVRYRIFDSLVDAVRSTYDHISVLTGV